MSRHTIEELISRWRGEQLTAEQMIGQMLLAIQDLEQRQRAIERREAAPAAPVAETPPATSKQRRTR